MRWIFWRRKPESTRGEVVSPDEVKPEQITVIVETHNSKSSANVGMALPPAVRDSTCDRFFRHRRSRTANVIELSSGESRVTAETGSDPSAAETLKLLGSSLLDAGLVEQKRLAYFTRGSYCSPRLQRPRLIAPSLTLGLAKFRSAARRENKPLLITAREAAISKSRSKE